MKFVPIFAPYLNAVVFEGDNDEFTLFIDFLTDATMLEEYFNENPDVLTFYKISIEDAVEQTLDHAIGLYELLEKHKVNLDEIFEPLKELSSELVLCKVKFKEKWIRLYAIKVESQYYIITGGAIKQSQKMDNHPDTKRQLAKLERVRDYLLEQGITDIDGFFELINEKDYD